MKLKLLFSILLFSLVCMVTHAQFIYTTEQFDDNISQYIGNNNKKMAVLLFKQFIEYQSVDEDFYEFSTEHKIIIVNTDNEIESNNKKYIPYTNFAEVINPRARIIKPNGNITTLNESDILTSKDEESGQNYRYFAFDGLEKGSIIEYIYTIKRSPDLNGNCRYIQFTVPVYRYEFSLYAPSHLDFDFKIFNDTLTPTEDTIGSEYKKWTIYFDSIPALEEEEMSPYNDLRKRFIYKFDANYATHTYDISSYGNASKNIYSNIYNELSKDENKAIAKIIKKSKASEEQTVESKIITLENYIKSTINIVDFSNAELADVSFIVENNIASERGITRLFANAFKALNISCQLVLTTNKSEFSFDKNYESFHFLQDYLIYFPDIKQYISPAKFQYRFGILPDDNTDNYGLFIKEKKLGSFITGIGEINFIEPEPYKKSHHNISLTASISPDLQFTSVDLVHSLSGYYAIYIQPYWDLMDEESKKESVKESIKGILEKADVKEWTVANASSSYVGKEPFIINAKFDVDNLIEEAGDKLIFKVGNLIGPQHELYSEKQRTQPVYDNYKREFVRELKIKIPDGYNVKNADDLKFNSSSIKDNKTIMQFVSEYKIENGYIIISINEYYDAVTHPVEEYEEYRKVVNSAADFNKVVLVFSKL